MTITSDFGGPYGSLRYIRTGDNGKTEVYEGKEASAIALLLARKVSPDVVLDVVHRQSP
jgi:hypothetical protein